MPGRKNKFANIARQEHCSTLHGQAEQKKRAGLHKKVSEEKGGSAFETKLRIEFGVTLWHGKKKNVRRKWEQTLGRIRADNAVRFITNKG